MWILFQQTDKCWDILVRRICHGDVLKHTTEVQNEYSCKISKNNTITIFEIWCNKKRNKLHVISFGSQTALTHCATIHCTINVPHHLQYMVLGLILTGKITWFDHTKHIKGQKSKYFSCYFAVTFVLNTRLPWCSICNIFNAILLWAIQNYVTADL